MATLAQPLDDASIDPAKLAAMRHELGASFGRMLGYFREDGEKSVRQIEEAARLRSAVALVRPAHTLKGEALQFGAVALGAMAERIEMAARQAVEDHLYPDEIVADVVRLRPLFGQVMVRLGGEAPPPVAAPPRPRAAFGRKAPAGR